MVQRHEDDEPTIAKLGRAYAEAILTGDEVAAELVIREAIDAQISTADIDDQIIAPALWLVGELWERGEITVADEHLATEISLRVLALQREARRLGHERRRHRILLATPAGEQHVVALRMVAGLLRNAGYDTLVVGADVPAHALGACARRHHASVVCMSATMPGGADRLLVAIHEIEQRLPQAGFVVGGRAVSSRLRSRPGIEVCARVTQALDAVDALVRRAEYN